MRRRGQLGHIRKAGEVMTIKVTCEQCGAKFTREYEPSKNVPRFRLCNACKQERKRACNRKAHKALNAKRKAERAAASAKVVKKCRRCGRTFEERPMSVKTISASNSPYYSHRYCPSCTWAMKRAMLSCDPRYVGVGGHGDVLDGGRAVDIRKAGEE